VIADLSEYEPYLVDTKGGMTVKASDPDGVKRELEALNEEYRGIYGFNLLEKAAEK
jgi:hypothetical protein